MVKCKYIMKAKNLFWAMVEAVIWYVFIYCFIYAIKNPVEIWQYALVLLVLGYAGTIACPWVRSTDAWRRMWDK